MANEFKVKNGLVLTSGDITLPGLSSGTTVLKASSTATGIITLPATTDTLVGKATTDTLTNKTLTNPTINGATLTGTVTIDGIRYPGSDGTTGQILSTNGNGQLIFTDIVNVGGYNNSSFTSFPNGDFQGTESYVGDAGNSADPFGVSLLAIFTCMDPVGSLQSTDLGLLT